MMKIPDKVATKVWRKPVLVGGVGLSLALWTWQSWQHTLGDLGGLTMGGMVIAYGGYRWFKRQNPIAQTPVPQAPIDSVKALQEMALRNTQAIAKTQNLLQQLQTENIDPAHNPSITDLETRLQELIPASDRSSLSLLVTGGKGVGKTTLLEVFSPNTAKPLTFTETPSLFSLDSPSLDLEQILNYDLVLFLTIGDLTDSEFQTLAPLAQQQRTILIFNKQDQHDPLTIAKILAQLQQRVAGLLPQIPVVGISVAPRSIKVIQAQVGGEAQTWLESPEPYLTALTTQVQTIINQESQQLVLATTFRQIQSLHGHVRAKLYMVRSDRSQPVIEQYQWVAAATAFANPVPMLDLLATGAINTQLIMDLGAIYQQKISLAQAENTVGILASLLVKLGLVEFSTQAIGHFLKSNVVTYVAGGFLQGASAAYLTRVSGLSLIAYFQESSEQEITEFKGDRLQEIIQKIYRQNQLPVLQSLIQQATQKLRVPQDNPV